MHRIEWTRGKVGAEDKILEVGCADNVVWRDTPFNVVTLDCSVRENATGEPFELVPEVVALAESLPFRDKSFDICCCSELLEHVPDPQQVLREAARVARKKITITVPWEHQWHPSLLPFGNPFHIRFYTPYSFRKELEALGLPFSIEEIRDGGWAWVVAEIYCQEKEPDYRHMWDHLRIRLQGKKRWETHELIDLMAQIEGHRQSVFEKPEYWCGELGYRPGPDGIGYRDFPIHQVKVNYLLSRKPGKVLDIGCAYGYLVKRLRDKGIDAWGVDISQYALSKAPDEVKPYLKQASADNLPFGDKEFDIAFSAATFEHLPPEIVSKAISEAVRVAKRGIIAVGPGDDPHFDEDTTHQTKQPLSWWRSQFPPKFEIRNDADEEWLSVTSPIVPGGEDGRARLQAHVG